MLTDSNLELDFPRRRALQLIQQGLAFASKGEMNKAFTQFSRSLALEPTAEGYTYAGWMLSFEQKFEEAIDLCRKAIEIDSTFGNPYNDIGSYLVAMGKTDEAVEWFERATQAPRYLPRQFPYINLARIYFQKGKLVEAEQNLRKALMVAPGDSTVQSMLARLKKGPTDA